MDYHQNARPKIHSREQMAKRVVEQGLTLKLASKCVRRYREAKLADRSSRLRRCPRDTSPLSQEKVLTLCWLRHNSGQLALSLGLSRASVSRIHASGQDEPATLPRLAAVRVV